MKGPVMRKILAAVTLSLLVLSCRPAAQPPATRQGWSVEESWKWYRGSQGSRLVPLAWLLALEEAQSQSLFLSRDNVLRFGYLLPGKDDETQLPIGFAVDGRPIGRDMATDISWTPDRPLNVRWVGLNCAACHTAEIQAGEEPLRIDGGPTLADFQNFMRMFNASLVATAHDPGKFARFAAAVLCNGDKARALGATPDRGCPVDPAAARRLKLALDKLVARQQAIARYNGTTSKYGYGRLDAVGHILNKIAFLAQAPDQFAGEPDAPVSYPFIWNAPQHNVVQWNGIAPNRNTRPANISTSAPWCATPAR
jgi:hypothetical protein